MKMTVYHAKEPNFGMGKHPPFDQDHYEKVAELKALSPEGAFEMTNHIDKPWWENKGVLRHKDKARSTSVGDVIVCEDGRKWRVEMVGMSEMVNG